MDLHIFCVLFSPGLLLEPSSDEASFNSTDDECPEFVELDYDLEFQGVFFSKLYVSVSFLVFYAASLAFV